MAPTTPTKKSGRKSAEQKAAEDAWEAYAAGGVVPPNPKQFTPDGDWEEEAETSGSGSGESGSGKEGEGQQESGEGSDPKAGPSGGN